MLPLSVAGIAALLSVLTGFFSGVTPAMILIRGVVTALLAAGFIVLADWLVKTFLPELSTLDKGSSSEEEKTPAGGSRVNIVMPDEMPATRNSDENSRDEGMTGAQDDDADAAELKSLDEAGSDNEIAESTESVHNNKPELSDTASDGAVDTLPNLDSLEIHIDSAGADAPGEEPLDNVAEPSPSAKGGDVDLGENGDPEIIAKAVKTVLARDQQK